MCEIWDSDGSVAEELDFQGCGAVFWGEWVATFWRMVVPSWVRALQMKMLLDFDT